MALHSADQTHVPVVEHLIYVRRSYKEATAADLSDEQQEAACRALLPPGASVRVISDSGGHQSGFSAARDGYQALLAALSTGEVAAIVVYDLSRLARNARLMLDLLDARTTSGAAPRGEPARGPLRRGHRPVPPVSQLYLAARPARPRLERMTGIQRRLFEDVGTGHDPRLRSLRDAAGNPSIRATEVIPAEAAIVRRCGANRRRSLDEVADPLNREGVPHRSA
jgi:hypothetical protein